MTFKGRVIVISDKIMLTKGLTPRKGEERIPLDIANLDFQLVLEILARAFPKGPGQITQAVSRNDKIRKKALLVEVDDGEMLYGAPWSYKVTAKPKRGRVVEFTIDFAYTQSAKRYGEETKLTGFVKRKKPSPRFSESMALADWKVYRLKSGRVYPLASKYENFGALRRATGK